MEVDICPFRGNADIFHALVGTRTFLRVDHRDDVHLKYLAVTSGVLLELWFPQLEVGMSRVFYIGKDEKGRYGMLALAVYM